MYQELLIRKIEKLSICIVSLNNLEYTKFLIKGLHENTTVPFEILLHINSAVEPFIFEATQWLTAGIIDVLMCSEDNDLVPRPMNKLVCQSKGDYIMYLDDDVYPAPGWDLALCEKINPDSIYQYLTPLYFLPKDTNDIEKIVYNHWNIGLTWDVFDTQLFNTQWKDKRDVTEDNDNIIGNYLINKKLWDEIGGYDENITWGWDLDFKAKIHYLGPQIEFRCVADCCFYHFEHIGTSKINIPRNSGRQQFEKKWGVTLAEWDNVLRKTAEKPII